MQDWWHNLQGLCKNGNTGSCVQNLLRISRQWEKIIQPNVALLRGSWVVTTKVTCLESQEFWSTDRSHWWWYIDDDNNAMHEILYRQIYCKILIRTYWKIFLRKYFFILYLLQADSAKKQIKISKYVPKIILLIYKHLEN